MTNEFGAFNPFDEEDKKPAEEKTSASEVNFEENHQQEIAQKDEERLDEIEDEYKELDEDILDIDDSEDTMWMIQNVALSILKIVGVVGIIGLILWSIWGGNDNSTKTEKQNPAKIEKVQKAKKVVQKEKENPAKKEKTKKFKQKNTDNSEGFWSNLFGGGDKNNIDKKTENPAKKDFKSAENNSQNQEIREIPAVTYQDEIDYVEENENNDLDQNFAGNSSSNLASVQIMAWNYWLEKDRLIGQKNTPGEVALWTKDAEALFDVPFAKQVEGRNDVEREKKVNSLVLDTTNLLKKAENLQNKLLSEVTEYAKKEQSYIAEATEYERLFLNAMNKSDPAGIDQFLAKKIEAEKKQLENGIEKESRQYLSERVDSYAQVLVNLREYLIANRKALIKDVQVVQFPEDPFNRIISIQEWESSGVGQ